MSPSSLKLHHRISYPSENDKTISKEFSFTVSDMSDLSRGIKALQENIEAVLSPIVESQREAKKRKKLKLKQESENGNGTEQR